MRTIAQHIALMQHASGATPDARHDLYHTLNRAGSALVTWHRWWWRLVPALELEAAEGVDTIELPDDFESLDRISLLDGGPVRVLTADEYTQERAGIETWQSGLETRVLLPMYEYDDLTNAQTLSLQMLSDAPADADPTYLLSYYRGWAEVTSANDGLPARIPPAFDHALMLLARAYTLDLQDQMESHEMKRAVEEIARLMQLDNGRVPEIGPIRNGAAMRSRGGGNLITPAYE